MWISDQEQERPGGVTQHMTDRSVGCGQTFTNMKENLW